MSMDQKINFGEGKVTKWMLTMKKLLTTYNLSIVEGLMNWKDNLEKEFEGIDVGLLLHTGMCHLFLCDQPNFENDAKG